jgi:hypothetical protein
MANRLQGNWVKKKPALTTYACCARLEATNQGASPHDQNIYQISLTTITENKFNNENNNYLPYIIPD